jgi:hypothetical protein
MLSMNKTSTFKDLGNMKFPIKVAFKRDINQTSETGVIIVVIADSFVNAEYKC